MSKAKHTTRRSERSLAFEVLYGLCFTPADNISELRKAFKLSPNNADRISKLQALQLAQAEEQKALNKAVSSDDFYGTAAGELINIVDISPHGFAWELVEGVWEHQIDLDKIIKDYSHNWSVKRIGRIELTILRLSIFEIIYRTDIPPKVAINESMELSKAFGDSNAHTFINGILDAITKALEANKLELHATKNPS